MNPQENQQIIKKPRYSSKTRKKRDQIAVIVFTIGFQPNFRYQHQPCRKQSIQRLQNLRKNSEDKIYSALEGSAKVYFSVLLKEVIPSISSDLPYMTKMASQRERKVISQLKNHHIAIEKNYKSSQQIKQQLNEQLQIIRRKLPQTHINQFQVRAQIKRQEQKEANRNEFRSKSYWNSNEKNQMAVNFIHDIQRQQLQDKRKLNSLKQQKEKKQQQIQKKRKEEMESQFLKQKSKLIQKYKQDRLKRQEQIKEEANQQKKAAQFVQKFKNKNPAHVYLSARYEKTEAKQNQLRENLLISIKQSKKHESLNEIFQRMQRYEQSKIRHSQEREERKHLQQQQCRNIRLRLSKLYKSRARSYSAAKELPEQSDKKEKQQKLLKMIMYSQSVKEKHPPQIDPQLQEELQSTIAQQGQLLHKIKKKREGSIILMDKNDLNSKEIGLKYLSQVKQFLKSATRKPFQDSQVIIEKKIAVELQAKDRIYSQKECFFNVKKWKEILEDKNLSPDQKKDMVENYCALIEEQKQKERNILKKSSFSKQIHTFKRLDELQLQKAKAKLQLLKEF